MNVRSLLGDVLWVDRDLAADKKTVDEMQKPLLLDKAEAVDEKSVEVAMELANAVAQAETDRETNLNARGAAVASVAALVVSIFAAVAKFVFATRTDWTGRTRDIAEWLFIAALVVVAGAMAMAVIGVLRPGRGGKTKNAVGEAVVNLWRQDDGEIALASASGTSIRLFWLDRLLAALPTWHYRNREKARWLRRAWMFLLAGIIVIGVAAVIVVAELRVLEPGQAAVEPEMTWLEVAAVVGVTLVVGWVLLRFDLIGAVRPESEEDRKEAQSEAQRILKKLSPDARRGRVPAQASPRLPRP